MGNILSKYITLLLAVILLFVFPTIHLLDTQDDFTRILVYNESIKLVDSVRNLGYITPRMFEDYKKKLLATNNIYEINLEHKHLIANPIYKEENGTKIFQNEARNNYMNYYNKTIIEQYLKNGKIYKFSSGDYFVINVYNKNITFSNKIKNLIYQFKLPDKQININYGGMIKNENY